MAAIASYLHVFNTHSIKTNTTTHALKLFLTRKRKLHEVTRQPRSLGFFEFSEGLDWGDKNQLLKIEKKGAIGTEGNTNAFSMLSA